MSAPIIECPICMDEIDITKNSVITDCGHMFHCSCLMQNAVYNGFVCPYCRTTMATEPPLEDEDNEDDWETVDDDEEDLEADDDVLDLVTTNLPLMVS